MVMGQGSGWQNGVWTGLDADGAPLPLAAVSPPPGGAITATDSLTDEMHPTHVIATRASATADYAANEVDALRAELRRLGVL